jgi:hypothetical protein
VLKTCCFSRAPSRTIERREQRLPHATIGIGGASQLLPPTPPYVRVRIRRFAGLNGKSLFCCHRSFDISNRRASFDSSDQRQSGFHPFPPFRGRLSGIQSHGQCDITASTRHFQRSGLRRNSFRLLCPLLTSALRSGRLTATSVPNPGHRADLPR